MFVIKLLFVLTKIKFVFFVAGQRVLCGDLDTSYQDAYEQRKLEELNAPKYAKKYHGVSQVCLLPPTLVLFVWKLQV